jgi:2-methylisocitrate lyase-like PEP mutase family enzyme
LIPLEDMVEKVKVAAEARTDKENFLIIARTDARQSEGLDGSLRRLEAYAKAGADILFPEALTSEEEMRTACAAFDKPVMANMADGGLTPVLPTKVLAELGYALAIFPSATSLAAASAMETLLTRLKTHGDYADQSLFDFKEFCGLIGFEDVWAFEAKWAPPR